MFNKKVSEKDFNSLVQRVNQLEDIITIHIESSSSVSLEPVKTKKRINNPVDSDEKYTLNYEPDVYGENIIDFLRDENETLYNFYEREYYDFGGNFLAKHYDDGTMFISSTLVVGVINAVDGKELKIIPGRSTRKFIEHNVFNESTKSDSIVNISRENSQGETVSGVIMNKDFIDKNL